MNTQLVILIIWIVSVVSIVLAFAWVATRLGPKGQNLKNPEDKLFDADFRTKLRERGVARFEQTLDQQAAFLQQDLRRISDDVSEHIKDRASQIIKEEFADQRQSVVAAQQHMNETFAKTDKLIDQYRKDLIEQLQKELVAEKQRRLDQFDKNMADIVNHYIQQTLGSHMEVGEQVEYIIKNLEDNKTAIIEDIKRES